MHCWQGVIVLSVVKLQKNFDRQSFDCGVPVLNDFLKHKASQYIKRFETVVYCAFDDETQKIAGFYTLSNTVIYQKDDPNFLKKQHPTAPISCVLIGRLAVDKTYQGKGLGSDLLIHALNTTKILSQMVGVAFVVVDAKDDTAKAFYQRYGFKALQGEPMRLCYPVKHL